ncbi:hypothetical protein HBN50_15035 [Halobacteriovorax sp. GB3]|nr:hypothetical protein [Halobacteriovorax sp. GB3]
MTREMKPLTKYYFKGLLPFFICALILEFTTLGLMNKLYLYLGYLWPYALSTPGLREKILLRKYRFSFLRLSLRLDEILGRMIPHFQLKREVVQGLLPFIYCLILFFVSFEGIPLLSIIGSILIALMQRFVIGDLGEREIHQASLNEENDL